MISIVLASYNGSKYIREQLDSILTQTYQDFELIICDDCSTDNTWQILEEYAEMDNRVKIYKNEKNLGFKKNFERGISLCNGEYIALSDQDDIWMETHLEVLLSIIKDNMLVCGDAIFIDKSGTCESTNRKLSDMHYDMHSITNNLTRLKCLLFRGNPYQGASMLFKKNFLKYVLPIPDKCAFHDEWFAMVATALNTFVYTFTIVNKYRLHSTSVTNHFQESLVNKILKHNHFRNKIEEIIPYVMALKTIENYVDKETFDIIKYTTILSQNVKQRLWRWENYNTYSNIMKDIFKNNSVINITLRKIQYLFF